MIGSLVARLVAVNSRLEKIMYLLTPSAILIGVLLEKQLLSLEDWVPWIFAGMTFIGSLKLSFFDMVKVLLRPWKLGMLMIILHVLMPLVGWAVASLIFPDDPHTVTGYVLLFVIPTGVVSFVWVTIYGGNIALTLSLILIDTMLSPLIVPGSLQLFMGTSVNIQMLEIVKGLTLMIVVPSLIGMLLNQWTRGRVNEVWGPPLSPFVKLGMVVVVGINGAIIAPYLKHPSGKLVLIIATTLGTIILGYLIGWGIARLFRWSREDSVAVLFNSGMRNISAGAVLAIQYFPQAVSLPVIAGMLFQQVLAASFGRLLIKSTESNCSSPSER